MNDSCNDSCAACGKSDGPLKRCSACRSVRYCGVDCQRSHRPEHRKKCKEISNAAKVYTAIKEADRTVELKLLAIEIKENDLNDPDLFKSPPKTDCAICMLPMPIYHCKDCQYFSCCGKLICIGCYLESERRVFIKNVRRENSRRIDPEYEPFSSPPLDSLCPFCRETTAPESNQAYFERLERRIEEGNDKLAMFQLAVAHKIGSHGVVADPAKHLDLLRRAADLGSAEACFSLSSIYCTSSCGIEKDLIRMNQYNKVAAKLGHVEARFSMGATAHTVGLIRLAHRHWVISAGRGHDESLNRLKIEYSEGRITEGKWLEIKAMHKEGREEMTSPARELAKQCGFSVPEYCKLRGLSDQNE